MISDAYVWLGWAVAFLAVWGVLYLALPHLRRAMVWASVFTAPFGLTEPLFVPEYWNPPSLFDLAHRTGFDIESVVFCFAIGGVGAVLVNALTHRRNAPLGRHERFARRHRFHRWILFAPFVIFAGTLPFAWNPIYPGIAAMLVGGALTVWCRPDLLRPTIVGGSAFTLYYLLFLVGVEITAPGYIERVWNLENLSGVAIWRFPIEELLFAFAFGTYWAGIYEHYTWHGAVPDGPSAGDAEMLRNGASQVEPRG